MTRQTSSMVKGAAAGIIAGGAAFLAVKTLSGGRRRAGRTAAKAMKAIGSFMDSMM